MQGLLNNEFEKRKQNIAKGFKQDDDDLEKGEGEGSSGGGGKVVGNTSGGKPIYSSWNKQANNVYSSKRDDPYNGHSAQDLHEIADHHANMVRKEVNRHNTKYDSGSLNRDQYEKHANLADRRSQVNTLKRNA